MDYNLIRTTESEIEYSIDRARNYGHLAPSMVMAKLEETDMGDEEEAYDNYARTNLTDWGPDNNKFEHEEARGGVNRNYGRLQLQYNGHRGDAEDPYRPEYFDGFIGPEDRDPRGTNVDPDMKQLRRQEEARMRFLRFTPDGSDHVTGGGRSEAMAMADNQKVIRIVRDRLKVFSRSLDGRRNGIRREFDNVSDVTKQVLVQSYGDFIKDHALTPQRRNNFICNSIIRDSKAWREDTADADFTFARYTQLCRRARNKNTHNAVASAKTDAEFFDADGPKQYKALGLLLANIVRGKRQAHDMAAQSNMDFAETKIMADRKTAPFARDLAVILHAIAHDMNMSESDRTAPGKRAVDRNRMQLNGISVYNHLTPSHHYLNAEILYKSVKPGADLRKIRDQVIRDAHNPDLRDGTVTKGKQAKHRMVTGAKISKNYDQDMTASHQTFNYRKALNPNGDRRIRLYNRDQDDGESDATQNRRAPHANYRNPNSGDVRDMARYGENLYKERLTGPMGSKYSHRMIDRDGAANNMNELGGDVY